MGVLAVMAASLAFLVGVETGRRQAVVPGEAAAVPPLVPGEVRAGELEELLAAVDRADRVALGFPAELAAPGHAMSSPDLPSSGWALDLAELASARDAEAKVASLRAAAVPAYRVAALVDGRAIQRLRVGGFASEESALDAIPGVLAVSGYPGARVVAAP